MPNAPINVMSESVTSRNATITWEDGEMPNPVNPPITGYNVFFNNSVPVPSMSRTVTRSDLIPFTAYIVTVTATNDIGGSEMSVPYTFTTMEEGKSLNGNLIQVIICSASIHADMLYILYKLLLLVHALCNTTLLLPSTAMCSLCT